MPKYICKFFYSRASYYPFGPGRLLSVWDGPVIILLGLAGYYPFGPDRLLCSTWKQCNAEAFTAMVPNTENMFLNTRPHRFSSQSTQGECNT